LSWNYLVFGRNGSLQPVAVKIALDGALLEREYHALSILSRGGRGPKVHVYDEQLQAVVMERVAGAQPLRSLFPERDEQAVSAVTGIIKDVRSVSFDSSVLSPMKDVVAPLMKSESWGAFSHLREQAAIWAEELLATSPGDTFLHGDLHHDNVLYDESDQKWKAIDPQAWYGELAVEAGSYIRNPIYHEYLRSSDVSNLVARRVEQFSSELSLPYERVYKWSFIMAVFGAYWCDYFSEEALVADRTGFVSVAEALYEMRSS
jgi:streptomycin 6-kinase